MVATNCWHDGLHRQILVSHVLLFYLWLCLYVTIRVIGPDDAITGYFYVVILTWPLNFVLADSLDLEWNWRPFSKFLCRNTHMTLKLRSRWFARSWREIFWEWISITFVSLPFRREVRSAVPYHWTQLQTVCRKTVIWTEFNICDTAQKATSWSSSLQRRCRSMQRQGQSAYRRRRVHGRAALREIRGGLLDCTISRALLLSIYPHCWTFPEKIQCD